MGDILLATPTVRALQRAFPGLTVDFIVGGGMTDALAGHPLVRRVLTFDKRGDDARLRRFVPFLMGLARERYDLVLNLHPSAKSYLMAFATGARTQITFQKRMEVQPDTGRVAHAVDDFLKELKPLGVTGVTDRGLDFIVPPLAQARLDDVLRAENVRDNDRLLVINPAASRPLNRWPLARFAEVAAHFAAQSGIKVAVTGAPASFRTVMDGLDEVALARDVAASDPRIINLAGRLSVKEFGALLARADAFLTCDTGPMHIAAAMGTPMVALSGAADPDRTGPLTPNALVLIDRALPCVPCRDRVCRRGDVLCMANLTTAQVLLSLEDLLGLARVSPRLALPMA